MEFIKSDDQIVLRAHYTHQGQCYLCVTVMGLFRFGDYGSLRSEKDAEEVLEKKIDQELSLDDGIPKQRAEFFLSGHAYAEKESGQTQGDVTLTVGSVKKRLLVFGDRHWSQGLTGSRISAPDEFKKIPLTASFAFGGKGDLKKDELPFLPNLELPHHLIVFKKDHPEAATFLPLSMMHPSRLPLLGTFDEKWLKTGWPHFPDDFNPLYFNRAPKDQWYPAFFKGDEEIVMEHLNPLEPLIETSLPGIRFKTFVHTIKNNFQEIPCHLDTLWLFPDIGYGLVMGHMKTPVSSELNEEIAHIYSVTETLLTPPKPLEVYQEDFNKKRGAAVTVDEAKAGSLAAQTEGQERLSLKGALGLGEEAAGVGATGAGVLSEGAVTGTMMGGAFAAAHAEAMPTLAQRLADQKAADRAQESLEIMNAKRDAGEANFQLQMYKNKMKEAGLGDKVADDCPPVQMIDLPSNMQQALQGDDPDVFLKNLQSIVGKEAVTPPPVPQEVQSLSETSANPASYADAMGVSDKMVMAGGIMAAARGLDPADPKVAEQIKAYESAASQVKAEQNQDILETQKSLEAEKVNSASTAQKKSAKTGQDQAKASGASNEDTAAQKDEVNGDQDAQEDQAEDEDARDDDDPSEKTYHSYLERLKDGNTKGLDLSRLFLGPLILPGFDFSGIILEGVNLEGAMLMGASFAGCQMAGVKLRDANLSGVNFEGADLSQAQLKNANLTGAVFKKTECSQAVFDHTTLQECTSEDSNFDACQFKHVVLSGSFLNTSLADTEWEFCDISGLNAKGCEWSGSQFQDVYAKSVVFSDCEWSRVKIQKGDFEGAKWLNNTLTGGSFSDINFLGADLSQTSMTRMKIKKSNFKTSHLVGARILSSFCEECDFSQADLSESSMDHTQFIEGNFSRAILTRCSANKANFSLCKLNAVSARGMILSEANLADANCASSDFLGANFSFANCENTVFNQANLYDCNFYRAIIEGASFIQVTAKEGFMQQLVLLQRKKIEIVQSV